MSYYNSSHISQKRENIAVRTPLPQLTPSESSLPLDNPRDLQDIITALPPLRRCSNFPTTQETERTSIHTQQAPQSPVSSVDTAMESAGSWPRTSEEAYERHIRPEKWYSRTTVSSHLEIVEGSTTTLEQPRTGSWASNSTSWYDSLQPRRRLGSWGSSIGTAVKWVGRRVSFGKMKEVIEAMG
ncbi:hypothetical protein M501DRAFT_996711 [Patellaria atrata CBS 101060]|uniref:Uncharacterized protein n=1 Tax=Patellaria atrata CBS 101060 TaxID=1346257 RepID=A0A9P4S5I1_9PEZI|nr:hypothetical protein M501DRAFT_996711 [Patellaria atrata CBS 101060]